MNTELALEFDGDNERVNETEIQAKAGEAAAEAIPVVMGPGNLEYQMEMRTLYENAPVGQVAADVRTAELKLKEAKKTGDLALKTKAQQELNDKIHIALELGKPIGYIDPYAEKVEPEDNRTQAQKNMEIINNLADKYMYHAGKQSGIDGKHARNPLPKGKTGETIFPMGDMTALRDVALQLADMSEPARALAFRKLKINTDSNEWREAEMLVQRRSRGVDTDKDNKHQEGVLGDDVLDLKQSDKPLIDDINPEYKGPVPQGQEIVRVTPDSEAIIMNVKPEKVEVPQIRVGDYPEFYARNKNLFVNKENREKLQQEADRLTEEIAANIKAELDNYLVSNPDADKKAITAESDRLFLDAQKQIQEACIDKMDNGTILRKFGKFMDKHGKKIKIALLAAGAIGAGTLTFGLVTGAVAFGGLSLGVGTAVGVARGASMGGIFSRHGSRNSHIHEDLFEENGRLSQLVERKGGDPQVADIARYLMDENNKSASLDHKTNVKKSALAMGIGGAIGGLMGSINWVSPHETTVTEPQETEPVIEQPPEPIVTSTEIPNLPPEIPHHEIQPGELTGQVINNTLQRMGIDGSYFVNPDGSTNVEALRAIVPDWDTSQVHSFAYADNLSDPDIRTVIETVVRDYNWGTHTETITTPGGTETTPNTVTEAVDRAIEYLPNMWAKVASSVFSGWFGGGIGAGIGQRRRRG